MMLPRQMKMKIEVEIYMEAHNESREAMRDRDETHRVYVLMTIKSSAFTSGWCCITSLTDAPSPLRTLPHSAHTGKHTPSARYHICS